MGIRGLTTFINNRSHLYLEIYELHDTSLVIDGNSIACQLYKWHCKCNDCFGGDYDKFANVISNFFQLLSECNITPYVILDGGYEQRKLATVISRMKNKIKSAEMLNPASDSSLSVFPLFIRETFVEVLLGLNVKVARCEFEGDTELASLAKCLDCPVLSYDSDFYIFDVPYIPFSTFDMMARKKFANKSLKESYNYISCKVYKIDNFLNSFGGLDKSKLPLLAVVMGNDYVNRSVFALFFNNLKMQKCCRGQSEQQKRIKSVIVWLQNETVSSAVKKIIGRYKLHNRQKILVKIQNAIKGYYYVDSPLFEFFNIKLTASKNSLPEINIEDLPEDSGDSLELSEEENSETEDLCIFEVTENQVTKDTILPEAFLQNFKRCIFPPCFMDMKLRDKYYCVPQIEDSSRAYAHKVSSDIFMAIHKILTENNDTILNVYARNEQNNVQKYTFPVCNMNVPYLSEIKGIDLKARRKILLNTLNIDSEFDKTLNLFPESLHLYIISLTYFISRTTFDIPVVYAITLSVLVLHYVDKKLGFVRSAKTFEKRFSKEVKNTSTTSKTNLQGQPVSEAVFENISYEDSLFCLQTVMPNFQVDLKLKNNVRLFDRSLVHKMSQFQSIFLHIKYLNSLLLSPFQNLLVAEVFNGTFIYNLSKKFSKRSNLTNYLELFLKDCPSILKTLQFIVTNVSEYFRNTEVISGVLNMPYKKKKKKRKNKTEIKNAVLEENIEGNHVEEDIKMFDPNNKFSLLSNL